VSAASDGVGRGATFAVTLPVLAVRTIPGLADVVSPPGAARARLRGRRILVVEDNDDSRELVRAVLEGAGAEVTCAASVDEAHAWLALDRVDVVLTDLGVPVADALAARFRAHVAKLPDRLVEVVAEAIAPR
jgi:PleD family two-component response regulator